MDACVCWTSGLKPGLGNLPPEQRPYALIFTSALNLRAVSDLILAPALAFIGLSVTAVCSVLPAPDSFSHKKFFELCGLSSKTPKEVKDVFQILDDDKSGYIEESELKCVRP